ncbi:hypothetical protein FJTKL_07337 [Diaporthe vaccinii]|uniref:F-box domain-containing protein n=1 Tax=Diaporthe vaccinii TaxID=105482 RepID=A0ABR4EUI8_9PEZI
MSDLGTAVTSAMESQPLSQFSFSLFMRLPAELQLEILSHCAQNDLVCLSLSSHALRALTLSLIPEHPWLLSYDQTLPQDALECTCGEKGMTGVAQNARAHRKRHHSYERRIDLSKPYSSRSYLKCHDFSLCRKYPSDHAVCRIPRCIHCACTTCPLHVRLRGWMGERKFCHDCRKFTSRPRSGKYKGRCLHGRPPVRRMPNNRWTYRKGQSYGRRWWRLWGTWGQDSWGYPEGDRTADVSRRRNARVV